MCGIVGVVGTQHVNQSIYDALIVLQHRGQDAAGIVTDHAGRFHLRKANGLVKDVFQPQHMEKLVGNMGIGHLRYPTAGSSDVAEAQPFYVNSPYGIALAHNGNLTNTAELIAEIYQQDFRHINTESDSEALLNVFAHELQEQNRLSPDPDAIFSAIAELHLRVTGAYAVVAMICGYGIVAFRDPHGIRPVVYGERNTEFGKEYMVASESVALDSAGFTLVRDLAPGEAIIITQQGELYTSQCAEEPVLTPCIFEHVYFARPDSVIDGIYVYEARLGMGRKLAEKIREQWSDYTIDVVIPIPDTSRSSALELANTLGVPYREGFIKNRYIGRTFIMPGQKQRKKSVRQKLNALAPEFKGKNVLLVDDSLVRGTTSREIIDMAREAGAKNVYFASAAPELRFPNVYGIDMPTREELIAHGRSVEDIAELIGADDLIFQGLHDLIEACRDSSQGDVTKFDCSVFNGEYITGDVDLAYLENLSAKRNEQTKAAKSTGNTTIGLHNEGVNVP